MKNLIKITAAVLIIVIGIVAINCSTATTSDESTDSTATETVVDTTASVGGVSTDTTQAVK